MVALVVGLKRVGTGAGTLLDVNDSKVKCTPFIGHIHPLRCPMDYSGFWALRWASNQFTIVARRVFWGVN